MGNSKYSNVLTVILVIAILAIIGLLVYVGIDWYIAYTTEVDAKNAVGQFDSSIENGTTNNNQGAINIPTENIEGPNITIENTVTDIPQNTTGGENTNTQGSGSSSSRKKLGKYDIIGKIEIPKTKVEYVILDASTPEALNLSICKQYGPGLNEIGNTVLIGHNFNDGRFFSNNKKLAEGDKIYITDETGNRVEYKIVHIYTTSTSDYEYAQRDTNGKRGISLSTCTNNTTARLIIWADEV